ncbi:MAG: 4Fe-4S binding protein [Deltaproteobacteria bacterium]|nr:4Fe-4S binding protein [Deltaproteobacteria bacterium]
MTESIYEKLARRLAAMEMGLPYKEEVVEILRANFSESEAGVAILLPVEGSPFDAVSAAEIATGSHLSPESLTPILERLAARGLVFSKRDASGEVRFALHRAGYGFFQTFFWKGEDTPHARNMSRLVLKYFDRKVTTEVFGGLQTKPYRYIPVDRSLRPEIQAVLPSFRMEVVIDGAHTFAVAHCPCRVQAGLMGRACSHPTEVCIKFDELGSYLIERGLAREISRAEARDIIAKSAKAGLVHFVDNAAGKAKHNCNCCGCACWNVGNIRRRKIPRDVLMAVYFLRETDPDRCTGCGECVEVCPVKAVGIEDGLAVVDKDWCIGCGVCATRCELEAITLEPRPGRPSLPADFDELHQTIRAERHSQ